MTTRLDRVQRAARQKLRKHERRPAFSKKGKMWTFEDVAGLCAVAELPMHADAKDHWNQQKGKPSWRHVRMEDERCIKLQNIQGQGVRANELA